MKRKTKSIVDDINVSVDIAEAFTPSQSDRGQAMMWRHRKMNVWKPVLGALFFCGIGNSFTAATAGADSFTAATAGAKDRPNILIVLIDDLGWKDVGYNGSRFYDTPHIDRLASEGMVFTSGYAAGSMCSPTRAAIQTGKHPARLGITYWFGGRVIRDKVISVENVKSFPDNEYTVGDAFRDAGYATYFTGKWHLGRESRPDHHGYETVKGYHPGNVGRYFWEQYAEAIPDLRDGGKPGEFLTDRLAREVCNHLDHAARQKKPFLMFLSTYAVHTAIASKPEYRERYERKITTLPPVAGSRLVDEANNPNAPMLQFQENAVYAGMVRSVDDAVGAVLGKLDELGLSDNTVVVFTSDNGGLSTQHYNLFRREVTYPVIPTSNVPLRASKAFLYEGGIRVPFIVKWPGVTRPGSVSDVPVTSTDLYPTFLEIAGLKLLPEQHKDGESFAPLLRGQPFEWRREAVFFHYPHYEENIGAMPASAVRAGPWKLVEHHEDGSIELYNLYEDIGEKRDLAAQMPDRARDLHQKLKEWREAVGARMPEPNPDYKERK